MTSTPPPRDPTPQDSVNPPPPTDAHDSTQDPASASPPPKIIKPGPRAVIAMGMVAVVGIGLILRAWQLWPFASAVVTTDNGYVRGAVTVLAPQVAGYVTGVLVKDFEQVKAGQVLVRIDDRNYVAAVDQAAAQHANALAQLANSEQTQAQNRAALAASRAGLVALEAEQGRAGAELARVEELAGRGSVSLNERDRVRATTRLAGANVLKALADIEIAEQKIKATTVARAGLEAQVQMAAAQLAKARIDLANTVIHAPVDGQASEVSVRLGQYVAAGSQLLFVVPHTLWVVANFKETQTARMRVGQPAHFAVDGLDGAVVDGHIEQIAPATGSEFSVLKADNATGNFTKVVQRLPVRIAIDPDQPLAARLRPGMSVVVSVDTAGGTERAR